MLPLPTKSGSEAEKGDNQVDCKRKKSRSMTWAQRLKRVFGIDIEVCSLYGDRVDPGNFTLSPSQKRA